ncbi:hypothetical protein [Streptomyces sp. NPDC086182]|uniref:hypothetical protein n=1 Tax=Streptomyces sp. NPDC086182 TaxID=3155058 RepID=UPI0034352F27
MPAPFRRPTRTVTEVVHGVPVEYDIPDTTPVIRLPFNLDAALRRLLFAIAICMTIGAIIWGTVAIGSMLTLLAPPWGAYLVAGIFDAGWAGCLIAEWVLRYDHARARIPAAVGAAMLAVSVAAIITDGVRAHAVAIGIIGALVSAAAKGMWAVAMYTIRIKLDPKYEAYLRARQQQAGTEQALALGERDRLLTRDRTARLLLALEARRPVLPDVVQDSPDSLSASPDAYPEEEFGDDAEEPATSADERPDPLQEIADKASGPSGLVRALADRGIREEQLLKEAARLRPDLNQDSIRRIAQRGQYL